MFEGAFIENHDPSTTQTLNREAACNAAFAAKNLTPTSDTVASGRCHQQLGFKKGMAIASLNINGLRSHLDEVQLLIRDLGIQILALNETKLDPEFPKELTSVSGYQQGHLERICNGGGVSIYIRDSVKRRLDIPNDDLELICIEVEPPNSKSFLVLAWYRPPSDLLDLSISWKKFSLFWTKRAKK